MKKIIIKLITLLIAFLLGIVSTGYFFNKGNLDMTAHMAEAELPILYFEHEGELINPTYGYTDEIGASGLRGAVLPLNEERLVRIAFEKYNAQIEEVSYEVRSADLQRLVQNGVLEDMEEQGSYLKGEVKIKDLLEAGEEYYLIFRVNPETAEETCFYARIMECSSELVSACTEFAKEFHEATLDPENTYPLTQYLETDTSRTETSLAYADIHSKYKTIIWDGMPVQEEAAPEITYLELGSDVVALNMDYRVIYENPEGEEEIYQVRDYFRVRKTNMRMYLLDYERRAEKLFFTDNEVFSEKSLNLGMQWEEIPYMSNEEGSVVNFVVSDELWSYDVAQNKLSQVFSFKNGNDKRGLHDEFEIQMINMEDSGSMDFIVTGYMNRGKHEGTTGVAVMRYDSLTNTTEELLFIESSSCAGVLANTVGELLYISHDDKMYLSYGGDIYAIDLNIRSVETLTENLSAGDYLISRGGDMIAWQYGEDKYSSEAITTMDMKTGVRQVYEAESGEVIRALAFSGEDFVYGVCRTEEILEDFAGNTLFPMHSVRIMDNKGELIREFDYSSKNKYVISAASQNNRIDLQCIALHSDGSYSETLAETITSNEEEQKSSIVLSEQKDSVKKIEKVFRFETEIEGKRKDVTPKQIVFEESRSVLLEEALDCFNVYAKGEVLGVYGEVREAIPAAYKEMGVVTDFDGQVIWERGNRKTRSVLELANGSEPMEASNTLEACIRLLLEQEGVYTEISSLLSAGKGPYEILKENSQKQPENFTGCNLSSVLYYISEGNYVLAMTSSAEGELIVGYDSLNIYLLNPLSGEVTKMGQKDAAARYEETGNVFFSFIN